MIVATAINLISDFTSYYSNLMSYENFKRKQSILFSR